ncbi:MAG: membrane protein [Chloroflexota bacterium]|nr:ABC transporter permease [Chloroflexota bacterium]NOG64030.1 ABC transporter permease [Chloroflexota bacterium]GIK65666.1 MAG: membrane protein [Chloroflexota bacterium]
MNFNAVWLIAQKELRDALRNRWFLLYTVIFGGLVLALSMLSRPDVEFTQLAEYNRTVTGLVNLVLLFVPLMALTFGASSISGERETGALKYLLAQPVDRGEVLFGKFLGLASAQLSTLLLGFGVAGVILSTRGGGDGLSGYVVMTGMACLLSLAMLSVGFLISALAHKTSTALGAALFLWLLLVFIGDLGLIGAAIVTQMPTQTTLLLAMINPLQLFKMASIFSALSSLEVLGPAGLYASDTFGGMFMPLMLAGLVLWILLPLGLAQFAFARQGDGA